MYRITLILGIIILITTFQSTAQISENWQLFKETPELKIESQKAVCTRPDEGTNIEYLYLKLTNKTSQTLQVKFKKEMWFDNECLSCSSESDEYNVIFNLKPNQRIFPICKDAGDFNVLRVFSSMPDGFTKRTLTKFNISNLEIKIID